MANETAGDIYAQTMCLCMPLRLGLLIVSCFQFFVSLLFLVDKPLFENLFRHFTGGYSLVGRVAVGAVEVSGVLFGLMGILGTWYCRQSYIATLNIWQYVRLVAWLVMFYFDLPMILRCEEWVNSVQKMTQVHGWNQPMYDIAMAGTCTSERTHFLVLSTLTLVVFMYLVNATSRYQEHMDGNPKHLLKLGKDPTQSIFYSHSLGERSYLNGSYGASEYAPPLGMAMAPGAGSPIVGMPQSYSAMPPAYGYAAAGGGGPADWPPL